MLFVAANPCVDRLYEVDHLAVGSIHRPEVVVARPGGKGLNAARAAALLGGRATAIGIIRGRAGDWIADQLAALGIDALMVRSAGETRTCVSILDRSSATLTEVYEQGETIEPAVWEALEQLVARELGRGDVGAVAVSGSLPPGAPSDGYARIARIGATRSVPVLADAYGPALAALLTQRPAVVKVNASEAADVTGLTVDDTPSAVAAARALRERGAGAVVITLGVVGAVVVDATAEFRLVPPDVRGVYPVGSGDAFLAGLAVAFVAGVPFLDAARRGMAAGIANALLPGAGDLDPAVVERLAHEVLVVPL
jgi:1-phosphofructokinase family hexose kinase